MDESAAPNISGAASQRTRPTTARKGLLLALLRSKSKCRISRLFRRCDREARLQTAPRRPVLLEPIDPKTDMPNLEVGRLNELARKRLHRSTWCIIKLTSQGSRSALTATSIVY